MSGLLHIVFGEGLLLDEYRSPEIFVCVQDIKDRLSISQDIEVFIFDGVESLASVVRLDSKDFLVLLKPEVLDLCTIEELKFVIGHEVVQ